MVSEPSTFLPEHFINRELSWLEFNARVLEEAQDATNPLLERVKFLAIFSSNLDEFFMVRVAGLREQAFGGVAAAGRARRRPRRRSRSCSGSPSGPSNWSRSSTAAGTNRSCPRWPTAGIRIHREDDLDAKRAPIARQVSSARRVFPMLTPMAIDPSHPSPRFHNRGLYLAAMLKRVSAASGPQRLFAVVQVPQVLPRFVAVGARRQAELRAARRHRSPAGCRSCSAATTSSTTPRSASRATWTSTCWSKRRTTCCGRSSRGCARGSGPRRCGWKCRPT